MWDVDKTDLEWSWVSDLQIHKIIVWVCCQEGFLSCSHSAVASEQENTKHTDLLCYEITTVSGSHFIVPLVSAWKEGSSSVASRPEVTRPSRREVSWRSSRLRWQVICVIRHAESVARSHLYPSEVSEIMRDIGSAIEYLHRVDIAHRDVKVQSPSPTKCECRIPVLTFSRFLTPTAGKPALHHQGEQRYAQADWLWLR